MNLIQDRKIYLSARSSVKRSCERIVRGDHANLHMAESCVETLRGLVTRPLRVDEMCIQSGESVESVHEKVRKDCHQLVHLYQLDISRGWTIGSSFYWNESSWDKQMFRSSKFSSPFLFRERDRKMERDTEREREREGEREIWRMEKEIGLTFASFIKSIHTYSSYCRRGKARSFFSPIPCSLSPPTITDDSVRYFRFEIAPGDILDGFSSGYLLRQIQFQRSRSSPILAPSISFCFFSALFLLLLLLLLLPRFVLISSNDVQESCF